MERQRGALSQTRPQFPDRRLPRLLEPRFWRNTCVDTYPRLLNGENAPDLQLQWLRSADRNRRHVFVAEQLIEPIDIVMMDLGQFIELHL